jgi:hypothetical protein
VLPNGHASADDQPLKVTLALRLPPATRPAEPPATDTPTTPQPSNAFTLTVKPGKKGALAVSARTKSAGTFRARAIAPRSAKRVLYANRARTLKRAGVAKIGLKPASAAKRLLKRKGRLKVSVVATFTPAGGAPRTRVKTVTVRR